MKKYKYLIGLFLLLGTQIIFAAHETKRIPIIENEKVVAWKTIIYPSKQQVLKMHRHENNRVLIALDDGKLKITNDKGQAHYLTLQKDHVYYLAKDVPNEQHTDENMTKHPINIIVVELKA